ncbi:hypothetical protein KJ925_05160 [Patescibacteria group bacterium]|nr:hypothetical protein [Patescibacteria group bacterium]
MNKEHLNWKSLNGECLYKVFGQAIDDFTKKHNVKSEDTVIDLLEAELEFRHKLVNKYKFCDYLNQVKEEITARIEGKTKEVIK